MTEGSSGFLVAAVDDDRSVLRSLEYLLESADYSVRLFDSGAAFLASGCLPDIACLVSDVDMPGIEGFELLRQVHALRPGLPVILITGYPETLQRLSALGGSACRAFTKPFPGPQLLQALAECIRNSRG